MIILVVNKTLTELICRFHFIDMMKWYILCIQMPLVLALVTIEDILK